ncbi:MAG: hypothetical protein HQM04_09585 [Magnetococcales bacterium]|nr:hypothetical protein [Magnetococcales bacterium]MBF0115283.1 hypothetical protein [Magnetococcales bacterium]
MVSNSMIKNSHFVMTFDDQDYDSCSQEIQYDDNQQECQYADCFADFPDSDFSQEPLYGCESQGSAFDDFFQGSQCDEFSQDTSSLDDQPRVTTAPKKGRKRKKAA